MINFLLNGGQFTFPTTQLVKNAKINNSKKRNPLIPKSMYPNYKNTKIVTKASTGTKFKFAEFNPVIADDIAYIAPETDILPEDILLNTLKSSISGESGMSKAKYSIIDRVMSSDDIYAELKSTSTPQVSNTPSTSVITGQLGSSAFNKAFDKVVQYRPEAAKYRNVLTKLAQAESGFKINAKNPNYPAYGYFQFIKNGKTDNIQLGRKYSQNPDNYSLGEFMSNPEIQINAAIDLAQKFEKTLTTKDKEQAQKQGYSLDALIAGSWLGGVGGVRKVLNGTGNPSDRRHSKTGQGSDVKTYMQKYG